MLVLSRKTGQTIFIGDDIVLTVTRIEGDRVQISFEAPKEVLILREELYEQLKEQGRLERPR